jgi:hypothetical protein
MSAGPGTALMSWGTLCLLGAFHGINPAMGWLFAVALGMQENRAAAVWRALVPLGVGHASAIGLAILVGIVAGRVIPADALRWPIAIMLVLLGVRRLLRQKHPRWGGMRIGILGLTFWSFLVATAHGAGLMVLPVWLGMTAASFPGGSEITHAGHGAATGDLAVGLIATAVHGVSYLIVTAMIAWIVFRKVGVGLLRTAWINLDVIWAAALIASGVLTITWLH